MYWRSMFSSPARKVLTVALLLSSAACFARAIITDWEVLPPEARWGAAPLFLLVVLHGVWIRSDKRAERDMGVGVVEPGQSL